MTISKMTMKSLDRAVVQLAVTCVVSLGACGVLHASFSADFNGDAAVDGADFLAWNSNKFITGATFAQGDANGDGYVGVLGDMNVIICQWSLGPTGSLATASASYNSFSGAGSVTIVPSGGGVSAVYLVNNITGPIATGVPFGGSAVTEFLPPPVSPFGFPATANSASFTSGPTDVVGSGAPFSTTFNVLPLTPVSDLQFFFQRRGQDLMPMSIFDSATATTFVPTVPSALCSCVPEPSMVLTLIPGLLIVALARRL